ncbi:transcriptional regulator [Nitratireductor aestuarii]|uniref:Transcriptional regulator n=1 Tax=Nitratireductor aestuarii TaxID=1735103 RepID=A0A916S3I4_9HYPH|nr:transcriptional regulator [Nitratireductor aestuarii]
MSKRRIDLNLLQLFDALVRERHVSRAAERAGLSQPAMSHALKRLRQMLDDPILVRQGAEMLPTATALRLAPKVAEILRDAHTLVGDSEEFVPGACERTFRIGMTDYASASFLPRLLTEIRRQAPQVRVMVRHVGRSQGGKAVTEGQVDLAMGSFLQEPGLTLYPFSSERYLCAVAREHGFRGERISLEEYLALPHLLVATTGEEIGIVDFELSLRNLRRNIVCIVPHFLVAPALLQNTDMVLTLMEGILRNNEELCKLRLFHPPIEIPEYRSYLAWREETGSDKGLQWLRNLIIDQFRDLPS